MLVNVQDKALRTYADVLGFVKKNDIPMGPLRWLSVVSPGDEAGTELFPEPDSQPGDWAYDGRDVLLDHSSGKTTSAVPYIDPPDRTAGGHLGA